VYSLKEFLIQNEKLHVSLGFFCEQQQQFIHN
jgi:hypothetical protein